MSSRPGGLAPGTLWGAIVAATRRARSQGVLQPIETVQQEIEDAGVRFLLRRAASLARKEQARGRSDRSGTADPFLPYDPALFVADLSPTHVALLNKFPVLDHHVLIVTRTYAAQETALDQADFDALAACMAEFAALGFYNAGREAGASQDHKHLQLVPLPLATGRSEVPIQSLLPRTRQEATLTALGLPFRHAYADLPQAIWVRPDQVGPCLAEVYRSLCTAVGIGEREGLRPTPYNLLVTREWMLLVPRSHERCAGISVNALGFAGSLFVKDDAQLEFVLRTGPMSVLRAVAIPSRGARPAAAPEDPRSDP